MSPSPPKNSGSLSKSPHPTNYPLPTSHNPNPHRLVVYGEPSDQPQSLRYALSRRGRHWCRAGSGPKAEGSTDNKRCVVWWTMTLNRLDRLEPGPGEVEQGELAVADDVPAKAFGLGPGAELRVHEHANETNVFHTLAGTVTVRQGSTEERIGAPGMVLHERGVPHGAVNETDEVAVSTASLCPLPGSE